MNTSKKLALAVLLVFACLINAKAQELIPYNNGKGKWGYCDEQSNIKIKPSYNLALPFINNTAITLKGQYTIAISTDGTELLRGK